MRRQGFWERRHLQRRTQPRYVPSSADSLLAQSFAFEPLLRAHLNRAFAGDAALVDDSLQEIYGRLLTLAESGGVHARRLRTQLFDLLSDVLRTVTVPATATSQTEGVGAGEAAVEQPDGAPSNTDDLQLLIQAAAQFPEAMRQAFTLRKVYGQTSAEISRTLGLSEREVERLLSTAAQACARQLFNPNTPLVLSDSPLDH